MSGGQSEGVALESLIRDLRRASSALADAIADARDGYHGVGIDSTDILLAANHYLEETGYLLVMKK